MFLIPTHVDDIKNFFRWWANWDCFEEESKTTINYNSIILEKLGFSND